MHHSTACTLIIRLLSTSQSTNNHIIIAVATGSVIVTVAKAADAGNMSQVNSNDTTSVKPVMPSNSSDYASMDILTMATATATVAMLL